MSLNDDLVLKLLSQMNDVSKDIGELKEMAVTRKEASEAIKAELRLVKIDVAAIKEWISKNKGFIGGVAFTMGLVGTAVGFIAKWLFSLYFAK